MFSLNSSESWRLLLYLQVSFFFWFDRPSHPLFSNSFADMLNSESNKHSLSLGECGMSHSCSQSVCSLVCTLAIHSPHHPPIPLTIMCSYPSNRLTCLLFLQVLQREGRAAADLNNMICHKWLFVFLLASQMCRGIFQSIWPLRPVFFWPGNFQRAATPIALLYVPRLVAFTLVMMNT